MDAKQVANKSPRKPTPAFGGKVVVKDKVKEMETVAGYYIPKKVELDTRKENVPARNKNM